MADFMAMSRDQSKLAQALLAPTDLHSIIDKEVRKEIELIKSLE